MDNLCFKRSKHKALQHKRNFTWLCLLLLELGKYMNVKKFPHYLRSGCAKLYLNSHTCAMAALSPVLVAMARPAATASPLPAAVASAIAVAVLQRAQVLCFVKLGGLTKKCKADLVA